ncbi:MAG: cob(I)yrinic acid a,c-diamide adenosyltransferase [Gammaproteobacteria bacterium]|nr:cob(I)yrinic acid a,c-diamide adenosyltransferase [Gammaproteobacteria bacterium]
MGHRLSKIVTRTGDAGKTGLADGSRRAKTAPRIAAIGDIDELNCCVGLLLTQTLPDPVAELLRRVQHELFDLGGELALPGATLITEAAVKRLDDGLARLNAGLPPLKEFVLPGGSPAAAHAHLARAVARRAERGLWRLAETESVNPLACAYLNRLSDALFVCARVVLRLADGVEVTWRRDSAR